MSKKPENFYPAGKAKNLASSQPLAGRATKSNLKDWIERATKNSYHATDRDKAGLTECPSSLPAYAENLLNRSRLLHE